ncbi:MurR/RpiR family transcriptional regulator [Thermoflavimicrobium dichotomicum]|uniref:DNA-binding transcriptional regulator, MurR/RpiR family, contains HTH and SIS domains n=1 Tax=Thermoflavimicrobium dichotomicum TaxID=46223 RepID=A0A1I3RAI5_9BACL|nr:MurR/RpiR family transcriptional regulator [Thermoflavimicrobium dichotomicum]SFJ43185.1 DNA-binding transcriptional regulator, MurR/RpiR family, contains HTH and SIS domains [Thermoflavimicrobium dichotomicum]
MAKQHRNGGLARIRAAYPHLSEKMQGIAQHILEHPGDVVNLSISQLAEVTGCAEATIFRLCKQLGFKGYQELKIALAQEIIQEPLQNIHEEVHADDDIREVARKVFQTNAASLSDTLQVLDMESLEQAVVLLKEAKRIEFYGTGGSGAIAIDAYHKFMRTGIACIAHTDSHMQVMSASLLHPGDVVVGISHSGSNKDILHACQVAKKAGAHVIAITSYRKSPLSKLADVTLYTAARETYFRSEAMAARIAQLSMIDTLFVGISLVRPEETLDCLQKIRQVIAEKRL